MACHTTIIDCMLYTHDDHTRSLAHLFRPSPHPPLALAPRGLCPTCPPAHTGGDATRRVHPAADVETRIKGLNAGNWDAIHVVEVKPGASGR